MSNSSLVVYTKLSPNRTSPRNHAIDTLTIHMVEGQCTAEALGETFANPARQASSNYGVDKNGRVGMYVEEADRSWCSSSRSNDHRAITIEVASDTFAPYKVNDKAYSALIALCVDICKRNGKNKLIFLGNKDTTLAYIPKDNEMVMTAHKWFADTNCPGEYLYSNFPEIAKRVTEELTPKPQPTPAKTITFPVTAVSKGSKGDAVMQVQVILKGYGLYTGLLDGDCGNKTVASILEYQKRNGLYEDGLFGEKCWRHFLGV